MSGVNAVRLWFRRETVFKPQAAGGFNRGTIEEAIMLLGPLVIYLYTI